MKMHRVPELGTLSPLQLLSLFPVNEKKTGSTEIIPVQLIQLFCSMTG